MEFGRFSFVQFDGNYFARMIFHKSLVECPAGLKWVTVMWNQIKLRTRMKLRGLFLLFPPLSRFKQMSEISFGKDIEMKIGEIFGSCKLFLLDVGSVHDSQNRLNNPNNPLFWSLFTFFDKKAMFSKKKKKSLVI